MRKETTMLIVNDDHLTRAGIASLNHCCSYCGEAFATYPLIMSDDPGQTVYHVACALELATDLLIDLFTFFHPPAPYIRLFTISPQQDASHKQAGGNDAANRS